MDCDIIKWICEVNLGQVVLILMLALSGVFIALYGLAEDIQSWWLEREPGRIDKILDKWSKRKK